MNRSDRAAVGVVIVALSTVAAVALIIVGNVTGQHNQMTGWHWAGLAMLLPACFGIWLM